MDCWMITPSVHDVRERPRPRFLSAFVVAITALAVLPVLAKVNTRADFDKAFDFTQVETWGWSPEGAGGVFVARTADDDPEAIRKLAEPIIVSQVSAEMPRRGLKAATGTPDLLLRYHLLLSIGTNAQTLGQFLPAVSAWGLPPFAPSTTSLEVIEAGSLVLDMSANGKIVWRGIGEAQIKMGMPQDQRTELLREAVREVLARYPPRS